VSDLDDYREAAYEGRQAAFDVGMRPNTVTIRVETWSGGRIGEGRCSTADTVLVPSPRVNRISERATPYGDGIQDRSTGLPTAASYSVGPITPAFPGGGYTPDQLCPPIVPGVGQRNLVLIEGDEFGTAGTLCRIVSMDASQPIHTTLLVEQVLASIPSEGTVTAQGIVFAGEFPLAGATVTAVGYGTTTTGVDGTWQLAVPALATMTFRVVLAGYLTASRVVTIGATPPDLLVLATQSTADVAALLASVGVTQSPSLGSILFACFSDELPAGFGLVPATGSPDGIAQDGDGAPALSDTTFLNGRSVLYANATPGTMAYTLVAPPGYAVSTTDGPDMAVVTAGEFALVIAAGVLD